MYSDIISFKLMMILQLSPTATIALSNYMFYTLSISINIPKSESRRRMKHQRSKVICTRFLFPTTTQNKNYSHIITECCHSHMYLTSYL